ncbi:MAG: hypothetical protein IPG96_01595 [Proteobacteria bacterium]|nr:hypothetical protein [Pseudomonadota bacterium]
MRQRMIGVRCAGVLALLAAGWLPGRASAQSGLEACGNISLGLQADCAVQPPGLDCETKCTPVTVRQTCADRLQTVCAPQCTEQVIETEVQVCRQNCITECQVNPASFQCQASCDTRCGGGCATRCAASADRTRCESSCRATCSASCGGECRVVLPSATCENKCQPSCHAEVQAEVRLQCQIACQEQKFEVCESELVGGCQTDCRSREGALFCDGQFVDAGDNLKQCIDALQNLDITVEGDVSFSTSGGCGLAASKTPAPWTALGLLGLLALVRRRRVRR